MVESRDRDIDNLLKTGAWSTRAKGPRPMVSDPPVRANQSSKLDRSVPRSFHIGFDKRRFPPPPSVEDEAESLAKEHGSSLVRASSDDDEVKCRGELDQMPILLPVAEHNSERRFVLVSNSSEVAVQIEDEDEDEDRSIGETSGYSANTCRKYVLIEPDGGKTDLKEPPRHSGHERRRSRQDLPPLETEFSNGNDRHPPSLSPATSTHSTERRRSRANSNVTVTQSQSRHRGSFDRREESRSSADGLLSPVIKHTTKGRDRAYWDINPGAHSASTDSLHRSPSGRERQGGHSKSSSTSTHRRSPTTESGKYDRRSGPADRERERERERCYDEPSSPYSTRKSNSPPKNTRMDSSPPRRERRKSPSPPYPQSAKDIMPSRSGSFRRRHRSPTRDEESWSYSSDENGRRLRSDRPHAKGPRNAAGYEDRTSPYATPGQSRESFSSKTSRPRGTSPPPSPRVTNGSRSSGGETVTGPRSATFPNEQHSWRVDDRSPSPFSAVDASFGPARSQTGLDENDRYNRPARPRDSGVNLSGATTPIVPVALALGAGSANSSFERKRNSIIAPPNNGNFSNPRQSTSSLGSSPPKGQWPPTFDPSASGSRPSQPITSYRRYSEDVRKGITPKLPECPRSVPKTGYDDWLTIPRADGFDICPSCFDSVFAGTEYAGAFVAAHRDPTRPVSCDFGSSPWYRIAYLMTLKYGYPDLRLLQAIASVAARHQACAGGRSATRVWYGLVDPASRMPIDTFPVCQCCARTVEALLPSLSGAFVPLESPPEPSHDVCEMHFFPTRKRFIEYFDLMETTADRAISRKSAPNIQSLANDVRRISLTHGCLRSTLTPERRWHALDALPEFTVCEECFDDVVWPLLEEADDDDVNDNDIDDKHLGDDDDEYQHRNGNNNSSMKRGEATGSFARAKSFQRSQRRALASCQLYSERMREVFRQAFGHNDLAFLERKVKERLAVEADIRARFARLQQEDQADPAVQEEIAGLFRDWKMWE